MKNSSTLVEKVKKPESGMQQYVKGQLQDPLVNISSYLDSKSLVRFSQSCRAIDIITTEQKTQQLILQAVAYASHDAAISLISANPEALLNNQGVVYDYSGKRIANLTPFQVALCACDVVLVDELVKIFIAKFPNGYQLMKEQICSIFPNGDVKSVIEAQKLSADKCKIFQDIAKLILFAKDLEIKLALDNSLDNTMPLHKSLINFRKAVDELFYTEQKFNPFYLNHVLDIYRGIFSLAKKEDCIKSLLFCNQIFGYIQRHMPACLRQEFDKQDYGTEFKIEKLFLLNRNSQNNNECKSNSIFPLAEESGLGYEYALSEPFIIFNGGKVSIFQRLLDEKNSRLINMCNHVMTLSVKKEDLVQAPSVSHTI